MTLRKTWIIAVLVLIAGVIGFVYLSKMKKAPKKQVVKSKVIAPYIVVKNKTLPLIIEGSGQVRAKDRIEIYSEVNGVLQKQKKEFRAGVSFKKGELMIKIDDSEFRANLYAKRSDFENLITSLLPDIKLEFPDEFDKWYQYLTSLDVDKNLKPLPEIKSQKEKFFITGKKVYSSFYSIRNLETRLEKYNIRAPFDGVVTESNVNTGTLIRAGQKIGTFSNNGLFELELSIKATDAGLINRGDRATIISSENGQEWEGKVVRINPAIDINTQTIQVFIESSGRGLREGMFVKAVIAGGTINDVFEISRNILVENRWVFIINSDSTLAKTEINPVRFLNKSVIVKDLPNGTRIVSRNIPGIFPGMKVIPQPSDN
jgi:multidrug efflux pump subunit AcrA (membrane-fusion protein)